MKSFLLAKSATQGRIQDFKLGGVAFNKIAPNGGRRENCWGITCEKSRFYAKKSYFFQFFWGGRWFSPGSPVSSATISAILLKVALNTINRFFLQRDITLLNAFDKFRMTIVFTNYELQQLQNDFKLAIT